jgi:hypothetical protein
LTETRAGVIGRYSVISYDDGRTASKTTTANKVTYFLYDLEGRVLAELGGANSGVALGSVYAAYSYGPGGLTSRFSGLSGEYGAFAFDIAGNVAVRQRQVDTVMDASEVYDAYGRVFERFNVQGANPDPVTDPIGSLAQFGSRTEEEDRAAAGGRYVRYEDGELYDPGTGRLLKSDTAHSSIDLFDPQWGLSDWDLWWNVGEDQAGTVGSGAAWEGFVPIWGSGRQAVNDYQNRRYGWASVNGAITITAVGGVAKGVAKAIAGVAARRSVAGGVVSGTGRGGLRRAMEKLGPPPSDLVAPQAHHELVWKYVDNFRAAGLDPNDVRFGRWVEADPHRRWSKAYQLEWDAFFKRYPKPSARKILRKLEELRDDPRFK